MFDWDRCGGDDNCMVLCSEATDLYIKTLFGYQSPENDCLVPLAKFKRDIYSFINQLLRL